MDCEPELLGCNQYITQRALGALICKQHVRAYFFAGFLKLMMPIIVMLPGIAVMFCTRMDISKT